MILTKYIKLMTLICALIFLMLAITSCKTKNNILNLKAQPPGLCFFVAKKGVIFLVNEKLRKEMMDAYADGDYKRALKLSQKLDKQILSHYSNRRGLLKNNIKEINI